MTIPIKALSVVNVVVGILLCIGAFVLTELMMSLRETADKLRQADVTLTAQLAAIQVNMVTRDEFRTEINRLRDELHQRR